jgi:hypothetical protein
MINYDVKIDARGIDGKTLVFSQVNSFYIESEKELTVKGLMNEAIKELRFDANYLALDKEEVYIRSNSFRNRNPLKLSDKLDKDEEYLYSIELKPKAK